MKLNKLLGVLATLASFGLVAPASAALIQETVTGTVSAGRDNTGEFGVANTNLTGASFTAIYSFDTSLGHYVHDSLGSVVSGGPINGSTSPLLSASMTINGHTLLIPGGWSSGMIGETSTVNLFADDLTATGRMYADVFTIFISSSTNLFTAGNILSPISYVVQSGDVFYGEFLYGGTGAGRGLLDYNVALLLAPTSLTTRVAASAVPEPETYAMLLAGLGWLGFTVRRRNNLAA